MAEAAPAADPNPVAAAAAPAADPKAAAPAAPAAVPDPKAAAPDPKAAAPANDQKGYWPSDWVTRVSKGDDKIAKQIGRYASPEALAEAHLSLRRRMDSGELRPSLPKDAKPEEIAAWRKDAGIPESPDKYDLKFDDGLVIGKEDQPIVGEFLKAAHASHFTPEQAKSAVSWFFRDRERQIADLAAKDDTDRISTLDTLNQEFGGSFRRNINMVEGVLSKFPEKARDALKSARLPDGTAAFNNPDVIRGFVALALEVNPAGIVAPAGGGDLGKTALDEYKGIQKVMREDRKSYDKDAGKQQRFRELADFLLKHEVIDQNGNEIVQKKKAA